MGLLGPWPSRLDAVLTAFGLYAGEQEGAVQSVIEAFGGADVAMEAMSPGAWVGP